jgi:NCAIR mutase (PurE)-related protein
MDVRTLLEDVAAGRVTVESALRRIGGAPYEDLGFARVDHHRAVVSGSAEVVFGAGKTPDQIASIAHALLDRGANVLVTRADRAAFDAVLEGASDARYDEEARVIVVERNEPEKLGTAALVCAGTSDLPVLREAESCARAFGIQCRRFVDVGVAGLHRILAVREQIDSYDVVVVVAGMEGALASVVAGLTRKPVIAVPTSVGYGASFNGLAALLAMLNACSSGITVVNIDNGFGAAAAAKRILAGAQLRSPS